MRYSAGTVKTTPADTDEPAEAVVCTMLFSSTVWRANSRSTAIEMTAAGIADETVMPAKRPRYALAPARTAASTTPSTNALIVTCGMCAKRVSSRSLHAVHELLDERCNQEQQHTGNHERPKTEGVTRQGRRRAHSLRSGHVPSEDAGEIISDTG